MKKSFFFVIFALSVIMVMASCEKEDPIEGIESPELTITASGLKSLTTPDSDTLFVEPGAVVILEASSSGPTMTTWAWTFSDDGTASGQQVTHEYLILPPTVATIELVTTDQAGNSYRKTKVVKAVNTLDGLAAIRVIATTRVGNRISLVMAIHKAGMKYNGNQFFYIGNVTDPGWVRQNIPPADTNHLIVDGALVPPPESNDVGKYVAVRLNLAAGQYEMGVGKIVGGNEWWGNFWGPFISDKTMIKFSIKEDGTVVPTGSGADPLTLPGKVGDQTIRAEVAGDNLVIYANNGVAYSAIPSPFIKTQSPDGVWNAPVHQMAVTGYEKWGKVEIPIAQMEGMVTFRYGSNMSQPTVYNDSQKNSIFWDSYFKTLKIICRQVKSANLLGEANENWVIVSGATKMAPR